MLPVTLDCPFVIVPSMFSNVYMMKGVTRTIINTDCSSGGPEGLTFHTRYMSSVVISKIGQGNSKSWVYIEDIHICNKFT